MNKDLLLYCTPLIIPCLFWFNLDVWLTLLAIDTLVWAAVACPSAAEFLGYAKEGQTQTMREALLHYPDLANIQITIVGA